MAGVWNRTGASRWARPSLLAAAVGLALSACGSGTPLRPDPPPTNPPPTTPPPTVVEPPNPAYIDHNVLTNAQPAIDTGLPREGVRVGVLDTGVNSEHPTLAGPGDDHLPDV